MVPSSMAAEADLPKVRVSPSSASRTRSISPIPDRKLWPSDRIAGVSSKRLPSLRA